MNILSDLIAQYTIDIPTKILDWIPKNKLYPDNFICNEAVVAYYEKIYNKVCRPLSKYNIIDENILDGPIENIDFDWIAQCLDSKAIHLLEKNLDKINWYYLSGNPAAIHILEKNPDKINWKSLSTNPAAIHILEKNLNKINWKSLSTNPAAIHLLKSNQDRINGYYLSENPAIFELDKQAYKITINLFITGWNIYCI
jgi:hypothetical protein